MGRKYLTIELTREEVIEWVRDNNSIDDVFTVPELEEWARDNGWVRLAEVDT